MPVLGSVSYYPHAKFVVPKSYLPNIMFGFGASVGVTHVGASFRFDDLVNTQNHVYCNLQPHLWSDRAYAFTLDYMMVDWYLIVDPNPAPQPLAVNMYYGYNVHPLKPDLIIYLSGFTTFYQFPTPPQYAGYWLPPLQ
jgi:hypothetical protein